MSENSFFRSQELLNFAEYPCYDGQDREKEWRRTGKRGMKNESKRK